MFKQIRQGDIYLEAVDVQPPSGLSPQQRIVLAEGELTGHTHVVEAPSILEWSVSEQRYIQVLGQQAGTITHADHDPTPTPVLAPEQTYRIVRQKVMSLTNDWKEVKD